MYTFPIKTRHLLAKKMEQFYNETKKKRNGKRRDCKLMTNLNNEKYIILTKNSM